MMIAHRDGMLASPPRYWGLCFTAEAANSTVSMSKIGSAPAVSLETSRDNGRTWTPFVVGETIITLANIGDSVCFRAGDGGTGGDGVNLAMAALVAKYNRFAMSGKVAAGGDISSILDRRGTVDKLNAYAFYALFLGCTNLTAAPALPATTLAGSCYASMFYNCSSLTAAPELPATTLAGSCYASMFGGCTSLTTAPALPATTLAFECYYYMFFGCSSLTAAPALPATTLAFECYEYMFLGCTSLTAAPALPATTLLSACYSGMFEGCTSLTAAPALPATTLAGSCYASMFYNCSSLTAAPELPATTLAAGCYNSMFRGCRSLREVEVAFSSWTPANVSTYWLLGVSATGTFRCPAALGTDATITRGVSNCPDGWTVVNID